ncbi:hypothetical protein pdam_00023479 [Pocillopora damicornis]|uniref:Uncharacterized protein n=1 Tax=Pocillopora damicornis TaxID=46731 RepID=A0A3M6UUM5_POCDA|nr:hypothetical protein pdam_00023479 [Pocillopora damicornis]
MKCVLFLYSGSDSAKAEQLEDYLQGKLRKVADLRNITDQLRRFDRIASLIQNKRQETEDDLITFDGRVIHDEFTGNKELLDRLRTKNDWVPNGLDERRIVNLQGKVQEGNPSLDRLEDCIKGILTGKTRVDSAKAEQLKDYLQDKLPKAADLRNITDIRAE